MSAALLVIDVQESFRHRPTWQPAEIPAFSDAVNRLVAASRASGVPVVRVFHLEDEGPFDPSTGFVVPLEGIDAYADHRVNKRVHSALVGTDLLPWLKARGIDRLIISGIRTEQCCETTARHASDLGFKVDYVTEATLTFPIRHSNGREYSTAEIKERTELVLTGRFATIRTVAEIEAELQGQTMQA
ncbi:isochorismatase family protein [Chitinimonas lacunae]|uniref:Isochorismatase family protein n=1 Tax=Chitinimonas lacunae TaxID=1963018 RepID=A0ABV8MK28_9NEIS